MPNLVEVVAQLRKQRDEEQKIVEQLERALAALGGVDGSGSGRKSAQNLGRESRTMSAAARKRIAAAQRERWAKWKAARGKKGEEIGRFGCLRSLRSLALSTAITINNLTRCVDVIASPRKKGFLRDHFGDENPTWGARLEDRTVQTLVLEGSPELVPETVMDHCGGHPTPLLPRFPGSRISCRFRYNTAAATS